ncbi:hypothetical protein Q7P37_005711 [Cladosporium fusiforme]
MGNQKKKALRNYQRLSAEQSQRTDARDSCRCNSSLSNLDSHQHDRRRLPPLPSTLPSHNSNGANGGPPLPFEPAGPQINSSQQLHPVEAKHYAGSRIKFGELHITLPTRGSSSVASDAQEPPQATLYSKEGPDYTPDAPTDGPMRSDTPVSPLTRPVEPAPAVDDLRTLPMHCVDNESGNRMTFRSQDGSFEVDVELSLSSRRRYDVQQMDRDQDTALALMALRSAASQD